jgi:alkylhydroperoxidase family enzyme
MLVWDPEGADDRVWTMLREHLTEEEIVELGSFIALTYGQQRVIKTWGVGHGDLAGEPGSGLAPARREP